MNCPNEDTWTMASMDLLDEDRTNELREHVQACATCREKFTDARRDHIALLSHFEATDRDHDTQREQLMVALPADTPPFASPNRLSRGWRRLGDITMNNPRTRNTVGLLSAAAAIIFAVTVFVGAWDGVAFANVVKKLRQIDNISCRIVSTTFMAEQEITFTGTMQISSEYGTRCEFVAEGAVATTFYQPIDEPAIVITPGANTYMVIEGGEDDDSFDTMQEPDAFLKKLSELTEQASVSLGRSQIDGIDVVGFELDPKQMELGLTDATVELFVDEDSTLPVLLSLAMPGPMPGSRIEVAYDEFEWNEPIDPKLFEPEIGEDFIEINIKVPPIDEDTFIEAMRMYAELRDGRYPKELDIMPIMTEMVTLSVQQMADDGKEITRGSIEHGDLRQDIMKMGSAVKFHARLIRDGDEPEYFGAKVTAEDVDEVLMQWRVDDHHLRQIYGDLSTETVEDLK